MSNLRPLLLDLELPAGTPFSSWIQDQTTAVQAVTIEKNGFLYQRPVIEAGAYVDPTAQLIGGIIVKKGCYIGPFAVVRLDEKPNIHPLVLGEGSNLQDGAVVHSTAQQIGSRVIVAHQAIVHGAIVEDNVTIYIQAVVDCGGTVIGSGSFVHQGAYVGRGIRIPPNRFIDAGQKVQDQTTADNLPMVPDAFRAITQHVLELNDGHVQRCLKMGK